jgi:hypothetical protein
MAPRTQFARLVVDLLAMTDQAELTAGQRVDGLVLVATAPTAAAVRGCVVQFHRHGRVAVRALRLRLVVLHVAGAARLW